ncbi:MAG: iron-containing redox enzyme family protein [Solirubrobacterales bacterium]
MPTTSEKNQDFWARLEEVRSRSNVLNHSFYQRWSAGELTIDELAYYAGEYDQAVRGLAEAVVSTSDATDDVAIREALHVHAVEEASHIDLWKSFADAMGTPSDALGNADRPESAECRKVWGEAGSEGLLPGLVTLYAIESGQSEISQTKLDGLREFYGFEDGPATEYFELHAELDKEHSAHSRKLIDKHLVGADLDQLLAAAERAFEANWKLLDGVEQHFGRPVSPREIDC